MTKRPKPGRDAKWILASGLAVLFALASSPLMPIARATDQLAEGSSSRTLRNQAVESIPFAQMNRATQQRLQEVVNQPSFYRRLPVASIDTDPEYFRFLVRKPEVIVSIWQLMGVTQMTTERVGPYTVRSDDGAGTLSELELVYGDPDTHIFYGHGSYEGPILKRKLTGRCVIVLRTQARPGQESGFELTSQVDVFLRIDNATAALVTRTIQPVVGATADHNFMESLKFVERLTQTTRNNGPGVKAMGRRLELKDGVEQQFEQVVDLVFSRAYHAEVTSGNEYQYADGVNPASQALELYRPSSSAYGLAGYPVDPTSAPATGGTTATAKAPGASLNPPTMGDPVQSYYSDPAQRIPASRTPVTQVAKPAVPPMSLQQLSAPIPVTPARGMPATINPARVPPQLTQPLQGTQPPATARPPIARPLPTSPGNRAGYPMGNHLPSATNFSDSPPFQVRVLPARGHAAPQYATGYSQSYVVPAGYLRPDLPPQR